VYADESMTTLEALGIYNGKNFLKFNLINKFIHIHIMWLQKMDLPLYLKHKYVPQYRVRLHICRHAERALSNGRRQNLIVAIKVGFPEENAGIRAIM
jgi:hypothetical protein